MNQVVACLLRGYIKFAFIVIISQDFAALGIWAAMCLCCMIDSFMVSIFFNSRLVAYRLGQWVCLLYMCVYIEITDSI